MDHLGPIQDHTGMSDELKPEHQSDLPLYGTMIRLDAIVKVATLTDVDLLQLIS